MAPKESQAGTSSRRRLSDTITLYDLHVPTPLTHFIAGAAASQLSPKPRGHHLRYALVFGLLASLQDLDFMMFFFGIPYNHPLGHRGFSHSLAFAVALGVVGALVLRADRKGARAFCLTAVAAGMAAASHGLLDMVTNGGLGVGILMPFDGGRFFFPFRPILVSPFSLGNFISTAALVLWSEILWVWLPLAVGSIGLHYSRLLWKPRQGPQPWTGKPLIGSRGD